MPTALAATLALVRAKTMFRLVLALASGLLFAVVTGGAQAAASSAPPQRTFSSPDAAADALVQAVKVNDRAAVLAVLGDAGDWISSGDATADRATAARFVAAYEAKHAIVRNGGTATLVLGDDGFPFAFPLVGRGERWRFDAAAGKHELLARRIGENELAAIEVLRAIVDAELEYASLDRNGDGVLAYAQRLASSPGKRDGLYWPVAAGERPSPLGELVARAAAEGYGNAGGARRTPYHGYYYRMLKGQGSSARAGAFDYVVHGRGIAGFAVVAYPARYDNSGVMTFVVNQDGVVYQSDLGPDTAQKAGHMQRFDPGKGWAAVRGK